MLAYNILKIHQRYYYVKVCYSKSMAKYRSIENFIILRGKTEAW